MRNNHISPKVSVIIPTLNRKYSLNLTLQSLFQMKFPLKLLEVIIIDNGSVDKTSEFVSYKFPHIKLIRNSNNMGFGPALNIGIKKASGKFLLITNDDVIFDKDCLSELVNLIEKDKTTGIVGGKMLLRNKKTMALSGFKVNLWLGYHPYDFNGADQVREMDVATGGCMLIRKSIFKFIGMYDEGFFFCGEDYDLCFRAKKAGFKIMYCPTAIIHHKFLNSGKRTDNFDQLLAHYRGKFRFMLVHAYFLQILVFFPIQLIFGPFYSYFQSRQKTLLPILAALFWNIYHIADTTSSRDRVNQLKKVSASLKG